MTPQIDTTPILLIAFAVILFLAVLSFISYVLSDDKTEGFEPYQDVEPEAITITPDTEKEYFTDEVIASMKRMVSPRHSWHPHWIKAFNLYNRSHPTLSMLCAPCYIKVLQYIIKLKSERIDDLTNYTFCYKTKLEKNLEFFTDARIEMMHKVPMRQRETNEYWCMAKNIYNKYHYQPASKRSAISYFKIIQYIIKLKNEKENNQKGAQDGC